MGDSSYPTPVPDWRFPAGIGSILVVQSWFDLAPEGPWGSRAFSRGLIGLLGLGFLYASWYRATFASKGVLPTIDRWEDPKGSLPKVAIAGVIFCIAAILAGGVANDYVPGPTGMLLGLFGLLALLQSFYVWLVLGPLVDITAESSDDDE